MSDRYQNGKIYTLRSNSTDKFYIGSTCLPLRKRLYQHKYNYTNHQSGKYHYTSAYEIVKYEDSYIELLEEHPCQNKEQLLKREGELIRTHKDNIVNKLVQGRSRKQRDIDNNESIVKYRKAYYAQNKTLLNEKNKVHTKNYRENHAETIKQKAAEYRKIGRAHV